MIHDITTNGVDCYWIVFMSRVCVRPCLCMVIIFIRYRILKRFRQVALFIHIILKMCYHVICIRFAKCIEIEFFRISLIWRGWQQWCPPVNKLNFLSINCIESNLQTWIRATSTKKSLQSLFCSFSSRVRYNGKSMMWWQWLILGYLQSNEFSWEPCSTLLPFC